MNCGKSVENRNTSYAGALHTEPMNKLNITQYAIHSLPYYDSGGRGYRSSIQDFASQTLTENSPI